MYKQLKVKFSALAVILISILFVHTTVWAQPCTPEIDKVSVSVPESGDILTNGIRYFLPQDPPDFFIYYVAGDNLDVTLSIANCTNISTVLFGSLELGTEPNAGNEYYTVLSDISEENDRHLVTIRLHFNNTGDGTSTPVEIAVQSQIGILTARLNFTLVRVKEIQPSATITISEAEFRNNFIVGIYKLFGDDGKYRDKKAGRTRYDPAYEDFELEIENDGIYIRWIEKIEVPNYCDVEVRSRGRFKPNIVGDEIHLDWVEGPTVGIEVPGLCQLPQLVLEPILIWVRRYFESKAADTFRETIEKKIRKFQEGIGNIALIAAIETRTDEIHLDLGPLLISTVSIEVPYGTNRMEEPWNYGMALYPGQQVIVIAGGLTTVCGRDGYETPTCEIKSSPAGLHNLPPIPDFRVYDRLKQKWIIKEERLKVWKALQYLPRDQNQLPMSQRNTAALVAKLSNGVNESQPVFFGAPCVIKARSGRQDRLAFGANDYRTNDGQENGTGTWQITIGFPPETIEDGCCPRVEPRSIAVTFEKIKLVNNAPPLYEGIPPISKTSARFFFGVDGEYRGFPSTSERDFPQNEWVDLPSGEYTFSTRVIETTDKLNLHIHTKLSGLQRVNPRPPFGITVGEERELEVVSNYGKEDNFDDGASPLDEVFAFPVEFGEGTHTMRSNNDAGFFEVTYTISMAPIFHLNELPVKKSP